MTWTRYSPKSNWVRAVFRKRWTIVANLAVAVGLSAGLGRRPLIVMAATPTPTPSLPGLPAPPNDGGVVAVENLTVYEGPGENFPELGGLPYGAFVYPEARTQDSVWLQIQYAGFEGWIYRPLIDMGFDAVLLPIPSNLFTPIPGSDNLTFTPDEGALPQATPSPQPQEPTASPAPPATLEPQTATPVAASASSIPTRDAAPSESPGVSDAPGAAPNLGLGRLAVIAAGLVGLAISGRYLLGARRGSRLGKGEFLVATCPVCGEGHLSVSGSRRSQVVRCDNCRSVLRQLRGGQWRYAVDSIPDKDFADRYNGQTLDEAELIDLAAQRARLRAADESRQQT